MNDPATLALAARLRRHCCDESPIVPDEQAMAVARLIMDSRARARAREAHPPDNTIATVDTLTRYVQEQHRNGGRPV